MTSLHGRCPVRTLGFLLAAVGCAPADERLAAIEETTVAALAAIVPDTSQGAGADDGQWRMPARNFASTRYSGLTEITSTNVGRLELAWSFSTGVQRGHEAAPLVVGSMMYVVTPFPNLLQAFDLTKPGAPPKCRFMAEVALLVSGGFTLVILALWLPTFWLHPCQ